MEEPNFVKDKDKLIVFPVIKIDEFLLTTVQFGRIPGWVSAHFRRDEFTFSSFKAENRGRIVGRTRTRQSTSPVAGFAQSSGLSLVGKESAMLSLASPVFIYFKTQKDLRTAFQKAAVRPHTRARSP